MGKILLCAWVVKGKIAFENNFVFQAQIEDLDLKCCILRDDPKNKTSVNYLHNAILAENMSDEKALQRSLESAYGPSLVKPFEESTPLSSA